MSDKKKLKLLEELLIDEKVNAKLVEFRYRINEISSYLDIICEELGIDRDPWINEKNYNVDREDNMFKINIITRVIEKLANEVTLKKIKKRILDESTHLMDKKKELEVREQELLYSVAKFNEYKEKGYLELKDSLNNNPKTK